jgi:GNAT superfamily N-acetyltransferase
VWPSTEVFDAEGASLRDGKGASPPKVIVPEDGLPDVAAAVAATRAITRARGKQTVIWWVGADQPELADGLAALGIPNEDTPGFEAVENCMALVEAPAGAPSGVEVRPLTTKEEYAESGELIWEVFGHSEEEREHERGRLDESWAEFTREDNPGRSFLAYLDGRMAGVGFAAPADAGVNLFGGAVLEEARGRGVYRALLEARWRFAVERGTPALTIQAGRMSRPIVEPLGFQFVGAGRIFVDTLPAL